MKKCKNCSALVKGFIKEHPNDYACIGMAEPFIVDNLNKSCPMFQSATKNSTIDEYSERIKGIITNIQSLKSKILADEDYKDDFIIELTADMSIKALKRMQNIVAKGEEE